MLVKQMDTVNCSLVDGIKFDLCLLCQKNTGERLQCPAEHKNLRTDIGIGYRALVDNIREFKEHGVTTSISKYLEVDKLSEVLFRNEGKWHKKCRLSYNENKLSRLRKTAVKRTVSSPETCGESSGFEPATRKALRRRYNSAHCQVTCFFCDSDEDTLHKIIDLVVSNRVRDIARETDNTKILAKLSEGDMVAIEALYHCKCLVAYYNKRSLQKLFIIVNV